MSQRFIEEVWDYRLSIAQPILYRGEKPVQDDDGNWKLERCSTWIVCVYDQGENNDPLEMHDTGVEVVRGDLHDGKGIDACYEFLRSVRDKYSRDGIEELKPKVAEIRKLDKARQAATDAYDAELKKQMKKLEEGDQ